ncbi:M66 family metalloprotease [Photobacterium lucens]|uniref:M66 family metalloprotease n=1 Tax=Photobacterium lucens TaxID=2562949 RepID=UPI00136F6536|nr:M66 family metalloprotease [Photobacterium lucens]MBP2700122.1 hypothetical protein [Vibrio parahaemolyticus]MZG55776.1 hypothetical protein [Photobacterium lucens]MZG81634.1 hypothetical protein [Photobacterium lucens]
MLFKKTLLSSLILLSLSAYADTSTDTDIATSSSNTESSDPHTDNKKSIIDVTPSTTSSRLSEKSDTATDSTPLVTVASELTTRINEPLSVQVVAKDPKGKTLHYGLSNRPDWLQIDPDTGVISGTPTNDGDLGKMRVNVRVYNGTEVASKWVTVIVINSKMAPTVIVPTTLTVEVGNALSYQVSAKDPQGKTLHYGLADRPDWLHIDPDTGVISGTPGPNDIGQIRVDVRVYNGTDIVSKWVTVKVTKANTAPIVTVPATITGEVGNALSYQVSAKDPQGKTLHYGLADRPDWLHIDPDTGLIFGTPGPNDLGQMRVDVRVYNGTDIVSKWVTVIIVANKNKAPVWTSLPEQTLTAGDITDITVKATDANKDVLTYGLENAPKWLTIDSKTGVIIATPDANVKGDFTVTVTVSDGKASTSAALHLHVKDNKIEITTLVSGSGQITPAKMTMVEGGSGAFTIKFDSKNKLKSITGCNGTLEDNKYLVNDVSADCQIKVNFEDVGYIPPIAFNTNDFPSDLDGSLQGTVLFAQNHVIPSKNHKPNLVHVHYKDGKEVTHTPEESTQHLIGERTALVMFKAKDKEFDETLPVKVEGYDANGSKLGTLVLDRPYKLPSISGVNPKADLTKADFNLDPSKLTAIDTAKVATEGEEGNTEYLDQQLIESKDGVFLHSTQWLRLHKLFLDFNPKFDGKYLILKADSPYTTDVRYANSISKGERNAYMGINIGQTVVFYNVGGQWFTDGDLAISKVTYGHGYWTAKIPASWMHYGLRLDFTHGDQTGTLDNINVGAPTVLYMNTIDLGMLTKRPDRMEFAKDPNLPREFYQTLPVSRFVLSRYQGITLNEVMMPDGTLYTDASATDGGVYTGDMRGDIAKSLISIGIDSANFGINATDGPGQDSHPDLALMLTTHTAMGNYKNGVQSHGLSGGGGIITLEGTVGNEMSHEAGHGMELGHSEGYDMSIHHPADQQDSTWGWDSDKNVFIPNFYKEHRNEHSCIGDPKKHPDQELICVKPWHGFEFGFDAMYGGEGSMYPDNRYTMYTPYSSTKIQRVMEGRMVFSKESPTGYLKWNNTTHKMEPFSYVHPIADIANANIGLLSQINGLEYVTKLFEHADIVDITTDNSHWTNAIPIPDASNVPSGSVIRLTSWAGYNSFYTINGKSIMLISGMHKMYRSNGSSWDEIDHVETSITKKPEQFGVPVTTFVGYYDPQEKLTSYIYPALHGSSGYTYADDSKYITGASCHLDVELGDGSTKQFWLPGHRLSVKYMNKFHVNIAESDHPVNAKVVCGDKTLATKLISKPEANLVSTVSGAPLTSEIS